MTPNLLLSLFPGVDLLGRGFEAEGYCVVRGPELLLGSRIESFTPAANAFEGVIGGSPCQDFSRARRAPATGEGVRLIGEFRRVVTVAAPAWWLLENVPGVPDVVIDGYHVQRFNLNAKECGVPQNRLRRFQFGSRDRSQLHIQRLDLYSPHVEACCMATEGTKASRRSFSDFCALQGLPADFDLPGWSIKAKYKAVGNGVPVPMARVVAIAVRLRAVTPAQRMCVCECGRPARPNGVHATASCRKRMERARRDVAGVTGPGFVTAAESPCQHVAADGLDGHPSLFGSSLEEPHLSVPVRITRDAAASQRGRRDTTAARGVTLDTSSAAAGDDTFPITNFAQHQ